MLDDYDYTPFKYDWHKNKHTLRYSSNHLRSCKNYKLECDRHIKKDEIPVTIIDEYFDNNFINCTNRYSNNNSRPLNKNYLWSDVEKTLIDTSIQTIKKWDPANGVILQTFNIPIKNYILVDTIHKELCWLKWNKQYYDPNYLYTFDGNQDDSSGTLKKYCLLKWIEPELDNMESMGRRIFTQRNKKHKSYKTNECYYQIDIGEVKHIQTIVTFGKYPCKRPFPKIKGKYDNYYYDTNKPYVNVVENINNDSYVKKYSVSYKDSQTQKWVSYKELDGNINSYTPKINPVDIYSRYIRIKPLEFVKNKSMIIYIYVSKNTNKNNYDSEDEEFVSYTLVPPNNKQPIYDGHGEKCLSPDWVHAQHHKTERKKKIKNMMQEELDELNNFVL
jgi:hypothetical protein